MADSWGWEWKSRTFSFEFDSQLYSDVANYLVNDEFVTGSEIAEMLTESFSEADIAKIPTTNVAGFETAVSLWGDTPEESDAIVVFVQIEQNTVTPDPTITVGSATAAPGDTVRIPITMANSPEFAGIEATLTYDATALTLKSFENGSLQNATLNPATGRIVGAASDNYTLNGTICTAAFEIKADAAYGDYTVGLTVDDLYDVDENPFDVDVTAGKITVSAGGTLADGYNVFMDIDKTVDELESVDVAVGVAGQGEGFDKYTNYTMVFTYDSDKLTYVGVTGLGENDEVDVEEGTGTLTVRKYGTEQISGNTGAAFTLQFTAAAAGTAEVVCTAAGIGNKGTAEASDELAANLLDDTTVITINAATEYSVTIDEGEFADEAEVTGNETAVPGEDYTFTVGDTNYDYTFTVTVGSEPVEVSGPDENGVYTIPGSAVTGPISITLTDMTPKQFNVTVTGEGADDVTLTGGDKATYKTDYVFTLNAEEGYDYAVAVTVGGETVTIPDPDEDGNYTIPGESITGAVVIDVSKLQTSPNAVTVSFEGTGADKVVGGTLQSAPTGEDFTFTVDGDTAHYDYTVSAARGDDAVAVTDNEDGTYTIAAAELTDAITVTVTETRNLHLQILGNEYVKMDGTTAFLIRASAELFDGEILVWDIWDSMTSNPSAGSKPMYYSTAANYLDGFAEGTEGVWVFLSFSSSSPASSIVESAYHNTVKVSTGEKVTLDYDYNVNLSQGGVDTNDAQLVWNMYNASYDNAQVFNDAVLMKKFLLADTNQDLVLNVLDSGAIVNHILNS